MSDKKKDPEAVEVVNIPVFEECGDHAHFAGYVSGVFEPAQRGEVIYEDKGSRTSVGGGNRRYEANYEQMDWN